MRLNKLLVPVLFALAGLTPAQMATVRGEIAITDHGAFYLRHTPWSLTFSPKTVPDYYVGRPLVMDIDNRGTIRLPSLTVRKAVLADAMFALGELTAGTLAKGWVQAKPGAYVAVFLDDPIKLLWQPLGPSVPLATGVWMLGPSAVPVASGFADDVTGRFVFGFDVPPLDLLAGRTFVAQAFCVVDVDGIAFSNLDSKSVGGHVLVTVEG